MVFCDEGGWWFGVGKQKKADNKRSVSRTASKLRKTNKVLHAHNSTLSTHRWHAWIARLTGWSSMGEGERQKGRRRENNVDDRLNELVGMCVMSENAISSIRVVEGASVGEISCERGEWAWPCATHINSVTESETKTHLKIQYSLAWNRIG